MGRLGLFTREQLAARYSLSMATIDFYTMQGLLTPVELHDGIFFTSKAFVIIEIIEKGKRLGFSLAEIRELTAPHAIEL